MFYCLEQSYTWMWSALAGQAECPARLVAKEAWTEEVPPSLLCHSVSSFGSSAIYSVFC